MAAVSKTSQLPSPAPTSSSTPLNPQYHIPQDSAEVRRLTDQHVLLTSVAGSLVLPPKHQLNAPVSAVLDAGCGPAMWLGELAARKDEVLPEGSDPVLYGFDVNPELFPPVVEGTATERMVFRHMDLTEPWGSEYDGAFDLIHIRGTMMWINPSRWPTMLENFRRSLKPGGWFQAVEAVPVPNAPSDPSNPWVRAIRLTNYGIYERHGLPAQHVRLALPGMLEQLGFTDVTAGSNPAKSGRMNEDERLGRIAAFMNKTLITVPKQGKMFREGEESFVSMMDGVEDRMPKDEEEWQEVIDAAMPTVEGPGVSWDFAVITARKPEA